MMNWNLSIDGGFWGFLFLLLLLVLLVAVVKSRWPGFVPKLSEWRAKPMHNSRAHAHAKEAHEHHTGRTTDTVKKGVFWVIGLIIIGILIFWLLAWVMADDDELRSQERVSIDLSAPAGNTSAPAGGTVYVPAASSTRFSRPVYTALGWHLCSIASNGSGSYEFQFQPTGSDEWLSPPDPRVHTADHARYRSLGDAQTITYYFVRAGEPC